MVNYTNFDGGREAAGYKGKTGDCVIRAIATALSDPNTRQEVLYKKVYDDLFQLNKDYPSKKRDWVAKALTRKGKGGSPRTGNYKKVYHSYILSLGFTWVPLMKVGSGCQVHVREDELPSNQTLILRLSKHLACYKNGWLLDTYDCSRGGTRCVYGYYIKHQKGE